MHGQQVVHRSVGGYHDRLRGDCQPILRFDTRGISSCDLGRMRLGVDVSAIPDDGPCQSRQVFQWVKLCLPRKVQRRAGIE